MPIRIKTAETYDNPRKQAYRHHVISAMIGNRNPENLSGLMLTGPEGKEIPVWRGKGLAVSKMVLIDSNAKNLSQAQSRNKARRARSYNLTISSAIARMESDGIRLDLANLDYDGFLTANRMAEIFDFFGSSILMRGARVCITYVKARDQLAKDVADSYCGGSRNELIRRLAETSSGRDCKIVESGSYAGGKIGRVHMAWVVIRLA